MLTELTDSINKLKNIIKNMDNKIKSKSCTSLILSDIVYKM